MFELNEIGRKEENIQYFFEGLKFLQFSKLKTLDLVFIENAIFGC